MDGSNVVSLESGRAGGGVDDATRPVSRFDVGEEVTGCRVDRWLQDQTGLSQAAVRRLFDRSAVRRGNLHLWPFAGVKGGEGIEVIDLVEGVALPSPVEIPLAVVYEDDSVLVIHKPRGLAVHPAASSSGPSLLQALLHRHPSLAELADVFTWPGIVHRLDRDTAGLMVCPLTRAAHEELARQFHDREVEKVYLALVKGRMHLRQGTVSAPIRTAPMRRLKMQVHREGRVSRTDYETLETLDPCSLVRLVLHTGRTHQIRIHMAQIGHPLLGDVLYGGPPCEGLQGQALLAHCLGFRHPLTGEAMRFEVPLPADMAAVLDGARAGTLPPWPAEVAPPTRGTAKKSALAPPDPDPATPEEREARTATRLRVKRLQAQIYAEERNRAAEFYDGLGPDRLTLRLRGGRILEGRVRDTGPYRLEVLTDGAECVVEKLQVMWVTACSSSPTADRLEPRAVAAFDAPSMGRLIRAAALGCTVSLLTAEGEELQGTVTWLDRYAVGLQADSPSCARLVYRHALAGLRLPGSDA